MKTLQCPVSDVTYSARDVVARVVRPKGVGIAASCGRARRGGRGGGRGRSCRRFTRDRRRGVSKPRRPSSRHDSSCVLHSIESMMRNQRFLTFWNINE